MIKDMELESRAKEFAKLTDSEWNILNTYIEYNEARRKAASLLYCIKKNIYKNNGAWSKSLLNINKMIKGSTSISNIRKIVNRLKEIGLICIKKVKKRNFYTMPVIEKVPEKVIDNENVSPVENTGLEGDSKIHRDKILDNNYNNTNTIIEKPKRKKSLMQILKEEYRGIRATGIASKKELREIAKDILVIKGYGNNNFMHNTIQQMVFDKIKYSNQKIDRLGAVAYMQKVVEDRINAYNNGEGNVSALKANNTFINNKSKIRFCDFPQREYSKEEMTQIERDLLGWNN